MFTFDLPSKYMRFEPLIDSLISEPNIIIPNSKVSQQYVQQFGNAIKVLRQKKLLHKSRDRRLKETTYILKCSNFYVPSSVVKIKNNKNHIKYVFSSMGVPKVDVPEVLL